MSFASDLNKFTKSLEKAVKEASSVNRLGDLASIAIDLIQRRTRSGFGVNARGQKIKLKPLSRSYIEFRKRNRRRMSAFATPSKSNLTFSNQLLSSLGLRKGAKSLTIEPKGRRKDGTSNSKVAEYVSADRPFLGLTKEEEVKVVKFFQRTFDDVVKRKVK